MATTPTLRAKLDAGAWTTGAITATYSQTVSLSLASTAGYNSIRWEIFGFPPSWPCPAGWLEDPDNRIYYAITDGSPPDPWDLPAAGTWGKWLLAAFPTADATARDITTAIEIVSPNGLHATPAHEGAQFGGAYEAWGKDVESNWRVVDGLAAGTPAILAATEADLTAADSGSVANGTRAYVASHRSVWRKQTSDGTGLTAHERIVGYTDGHVYQRELVRSAYYELQPEWWVDPDAGSDEATGATSGAPIKTLKELFRRVAPDGVWHVSRAITVHVGNNYVGSTLPDITFHTGTGAVTVSFVGWEADPNVNTAFTVDSAVAQDAATNAIQSVTMTASLTWAQGDIVRNDSVNGGDCYHVVGYVDVGVPERAHVQPGTDSLGGDNAANPEASNVMRKVSLAPLEVTGIRVIGGVSISIALCAVHMGDETKRTARLDGVVFRCCQLSGVRLGQGSAATTCAFKTTNAIANVGQNDASEGDSGFLYKCGIIGPTTIANGCYANLAQCYFRSFLILESKAQVAIADVCACNVASNGGIFDIGGDDHVIDCSVAYSLFGSGHHIVTVGPAVTRGQIRLLTDGTSWGFAGGGGYDFRYDGSGAEWNQWYPWPSATAANYPSCADIDTYANWIAAPFSGTFARNRYSDLIIISTDPVS